MRGARVPLLALALVICLAAAALAATPEKNAHYSGTGTDYLNDAGAHWANDGGAQSVSFKTSKDGSQIVDFKGWFSYYCGAGHDYLDANPFAIAADGSFSDQFVIKESSSKIYASISGHFLKGGKAKVDYLVDFVFTATKIKHPYDTSKPHSLGCASWVKATVKAG